MTERAFRRWATLALLAVLVAAFGAVGWAAQEGKPALDMGDSSALNVTSDIKDRLMVEALPLMVNLGFDPEDFDFGRALTFEDGVLYVPIQRTSLVDEFIRGKRARLLAGFLYTREPFDFLGQRYEKGGHPVILLGEIPIDVESSLKRHKQPPQEKQDTEKFTIRNTQICQPGAICIFLPPPPTPPFPRPPSGPGNLCAAASGAAIFARAVGPVTAIVVGSVALLLCLSGN